MPAPDEPSAPSLVPGIPPDRTRVTCREVARVLDVSAEHIRRLCETGEIAAEQNAGYKTRSVNSWSIPVAALADFLRRRTMRRAE